MSKSVLLYEPTIEDDGRYLTCRAENAALRNTAMEDQWTIQVHCKQLLLTQFDLPDRLIIFPANPLESLFLLFAKKDLFMHAAHVVTCVVGQPSVFQLVNLQRLFFC